MTIDDETDELRSGDSVFSRAMAELRPEAKYTHGVSIYYMRNGVVQPAFVLLSCVGDTAWADVYVGVGQAVHHTVYNGEAESIAREAGCAILALCLHGGKCIVRPIGLLGAEVLRNHFNLREEEA